MDTIIHSDCRFFKGDIPCLPHKKFGVHCFNCTPYDKVSVDILVIKLGAIGDVIRTTPIIDALRKKYVGCRITWITQSPQILHPDSLERILPWNFESILYLQNTPFEIAINLDKDKEACSLMKSVNSNIQFGFTLQNGVPSTCSSLADHKFLTGLFDDYSQQNTKSYLTEIFEICDLEYQSQSYQINTKHLSDYHWDIPTNSKIIGLNTGCGDRWTSRLWPDEYWVSLIQLLQNNGFSPLLLGGKQEDQKNSELAKNTGVIYLGHFPLDQFVSLVNQTELVVSQVTMGMHITLALGKKLVLMNNIFNKHEFDLFDNGVIIEPTKKCECFYLGKCKNGQSCMTDILPEAIFSAILKLA